MWYLTRASAATVSLAATTADGGDAAGDTFTNIEGVIGSNHNDILTAAATGSRLRGGLGNDTITGGAGNDTFYGGLAADIEGLTTKTYAGQADIIHGVVGDDNIHSNDHNVGDKDKLAVAAASHRYPDLRRGRQRTDHRAAFVQSIVVVELTR